MTTVELILFGLIALVPNEEDKTLTVLLPDTQPEFHLPALWLLEGECSSGTCLNGPGSVTDPEYSKKLSTQKLKSWVESFGESPPQLVWVLPKGEVQILPEAEGLGRSPLAFSTPISRFRDPTMYSPEELRSTIWIPDLGTLGAPNAKAACREGELAPESCPAVTRLTLKNAVFDVCHLLHEPDNVNVNFRYLPFSFIRQGLSDKALEKPGLAVPLIRPLADATRVVFEVDSDVLTLSVGETSAVLKGADCAGNGCSRTVRLLLTHLPLLPGGEHSHFKHYFDLAEAAPAQRPYPWRPDDQHKQEWARTLFAGFLNQNQPPCEPSLERFEGLYARLRKDVLGMEFDCSHTCPKCDSASFRDFASPE